MPRTAAGSEFRIETVPVSEFMEKVFEPLKGIAGVDEGPFPFPIAAGRFSPERVEEHVESIRSGDWGALVHDPIVIATDGEIWEGQHRLAAIWRVLQGGERLEDDPALVLFWGVTDKYLKQGYLFDDIEAMLLDNLNEFYRWLGVEDDAT